MHKDLCNHTARSRVRSPLMPPAVTRLCSRGATAREPGRAKGREPGTESARQGETGPKGAARTRGLQLCCINLCAHTAPPSSQIAERCVHKDSRNTPCVIQTSRVGPGPGLERAGPLPGAADSDAHRPARVRARPGAAGRKVRRGFGGIGARPGAGVGAGAWAPRAGEAPVLHLDNDLRRIRIMDNSGGGGTCPAPR